MYVCPHVPDKYGQITWVIVACTFAYSILDASFKGWWTATVNHLSLWVGGEEIPWASYIIPPLLSLKECLNFLSANKKQNIKDKRKHDSTRRFNFGRSNVRYQQKNAVRAWNRTSQKERILSQLPFFTGYYGFVSFTSTHFANTRWYLSNSMNSYKTSTQQPSCYAIFFTQQWRRGWVQLMPYGEKNTTSPAKPPMSWHLVIFPHGKGTVFFGQQFVFICVFPNIQKSSKIQSTLEGEVTIATYALSKSLLITRCFTCCPIQSSSSPLTSYVVRWDPLSGCW